MPLEVHVAFRHLNPELGEGWIDIKVGLYGTCSDQVEALVVPCVVDEQISAGGKFTERFKLRRFAVDQEALAGVETIFLNY